MMFMAIPFDGRLPGLKALWRTPFFLIDPRVDCGRGTRAGIFLT
jgi:hypothetical protein